MPPPVLVKAIPDQVINEQAAFGPLDLKQYIEAEEKITFVAEIKGGAALPKGMICTSDGILTGIPAKGTQGRYEVSIQAETASGKITTEFVFNIKPSLFDESEITYLSQLKSQVWQALENRLPAPELSELYNRPVSELDIYYLLERWGVLIVWDATNLAPSSEKKVLHLEGVSPHYEIYDRGSSLIAAPKDLYDHNRTILDGLITAKALAREVYRREWTIEMAGVDKMTRSAWVEFQHLADKYGKNIEIVNFSPTPDDVKLYSSDLSLGPTKKGGGE